MDMIDKWYSLYKAVVAIRGNDNMTKFMGTSLKIFKTKESNVWAMFSFFFGYLGDHVVTIF